MTSDKNISSQWYEGDLECSFHTLTFLESKVEELKVSHIKPHGRKVISNASPYSGDPNTLKEIHSYLNDRILSGVEVFPLNNSDYPLDIPRKFNVTEAVIIDPQISNVRIVDYKKQGTLNAKVYFRLVKSGSINGPEKELKDRIPKHLTDETFFINNFEVENHVVEASKSSSVDSNTKNILKDEFPTKALNKGCISPRIPQGCLNSFGGDGCLSQGIQGGCYNGLRFGCGGLIILLLLLGLITMFLRGCNSEDIVESDNTETEIEPERENVDLAPWEIEDKELQKRPDEDTLTKTKIKTIIVPNVQFYTNSAELLPNSKKNLNTIALYMFENPTIKGVITGHTDSVGDENKNQTLSLQRAESVMLYLLNYGIDQNRLSAEGKGESEPIASNEKLEGRSMNRRVEITFYN